jgi:hypothetical protein
VLVARKHRRIEEEEAEPAGELEPATVQRRRAAVSPVDINPSSETPDAGGTPALLAPAGDVT